MLLIVRKGETPPFKSLFGCKLGIELGICCGGLEPCLRLPLPPFNTFDHPSYVLIQVKDLWL
jgi:hypothetical protein